MTELLEREDGVPRVLLLTARPEELPSALGSLDGVTRKLHQNRPYHVWSTSRVEVRVLPTGVGRREVEETLADLGGVLQPDLVLVAGTAGGLGEDLDRGSLFLPTAVTAPGSADWLYPSTEILEWTREVVSLSERDEPVRSGPLVTVEDPVLAREDRETLSRDQGAMAVDMETFHAVRRLTGRNGEPPLWCGLRVISDGPDDEGLMRVIGLQEAACQRLGEHLVALFGALEAPETWGD